MWGRLLKDYPDEIVSAAFYKAMQTCKVPPTPADVIERIKEFGKIDKPTPEELWSTLKKAIKETQRQVYYFRFNFVDESGMSQGDRARQKVEQVWQGLPESLKAYLSCKEEMMNLARAEEEDLKYEKARFLKTLPIIEQRQEDKKLLLALNIELPELKRLE